MRQPARPRSGSSPLTRGKHPATGVGAAYAGLIPAHAGKTRIATSVWSLSTAHPRSRGENLEEDSGLVDFLGSSPLTRGKLVDGVDRDGATGLIPAHAGKTRPRHPSHRGSRAHPRSRGENAAGIASVALTQGSSPLTRGKLRGHRRRVRRERLIPAHAGKTLPDLRFYRADRSDLGKP